MSKSPVIKYSLTTGSIYFLFWYLIWYFDILIIIYY
uniref:Uncharacterized protein n=1 Tax=Myoviridae sp. ctTK08 TaxID=2826656 RepID=A0A8S5QX89_9CAUD|nr:MAG TPA: hypothetical protein [Myoviridae sp. ctTK08]DAN66177.1 MAG TPA: hypothetical protein [Caudoviricetes sp.]